MIAKVAMQASDLYADAYSSMHVGSVKQQWDKVNDPSTHTYTLDFEVFVVYTVGLDEPDSISSFVWKCVPFIAFPSLVLPQGWLPTVVAKQAYFHAVAQHRLGLVAQANKNYGEAVARMKVGQLCL